MVNQVALAYSFGPIMQPFRELVKHNATFVWNDLLDQAFQESKVKIVELVKEGIAAFDVNRVTCLHQIGVRKVWASSFCKSTVIV